MSPELVLASTSPRRALILGALRIPFRVVASDIDESLLPREAPEAAAERLAREKARAVTEVSKAVQQLSLAGIRARHPGASDGECMLRLAVLKLGRQLARRVYPAVADLSGR